MSEEKCGNCKYFKKNNECRRYPPYALLASISDNRRNDAKDISNVMAFPSVNTDSWCGEFSNKYTEIAPAKRPTENEVQNLKFVHLVDQLLKLEREVLTIDPEKGFNFRIAPDGNFVRWKDIENLIKLKGDDK